MFLNFNLRGILSGNEFEYNEYYKNMLLNLSTFQSGCYFYLICFTIMLTYILKHVTQMIGFRQWSKIKSLVNQENSQGKIY